MFLILFSKAFTFIGGACVDVCCKAFKVCIDNKGDSHFSVVIVVILKTNIREISIFVYRWHFNTDFCHSIRYAFLERSLIGTS